jgi:hypothetical protein
MAFVILNKKSPSVEKASAFSADAFFWRSFAILLL